MFKNILNKQLPRSVVVVVPTLCFMVSVMISQQLRLHDGWWLVISLPWIVLGWRAHGIVLLCGLILLATVAGCLRGTQYMDKKDVYGRLEGQNVLLAGQASSDAVYGNKHQLVFDLRDARLARDGQRLVGTLQISGFGESMVYKGDRIEVRGKLFTSRGNNSGRISYATLTLLSRGQSMIDDVRRRFAAGMQSTVPEPAASFGMGLLVGQRNTLPKDVSEQLQKVGLTHIIAVSGYNLTIIMQAVGRVMKKRSKFQYMFLSIGLMLTFLLLTGQSPSIVRASVVCGLGLWAWWYGRTIKPIVLLMTAAAITIAANPLYAWGNVSWMLSFLAFFGVLVVSPIIMHRWHSGREPGFIAGIIIESLCAEVMTLPYVLFIFGQMSTVATFSNLLVASFVPLAMLCSVIAGLVGMICPTVAGWLSWPATMVMTYMLDVVHILSEIPHAFVEGIGFSVWMMVSSYGLVGIMLWIAWHRGHQNGIITDNTERNEKE